MIKKVEKYSVITKMIKKNSSEIIGLRGKVIRND